jgi:hypothetical protein
MTNGPASRFGHLLSASLKAGCLLLLVAAAHADTVYLDLNQVPPLYTFTDSSGDSVSNYVGPYPTLLASTPGGSSPQIFSICFDINNPTDGGLWYSGQLVTNTDTATLEATFLINLLSLDGGPSAPIAVKGAISYAIWDIMFPSSTDSEGGGYDDDPAAQPYVNLAVWEVANNVWTVADSALYPTFMPDNKSSQRFGIILQDTPPIYLPEPGGWLLLGTGLPVLGLLLRRRARHSA